MVLKFLYSSKFLQIHFKYDISHLQDETEREFNHNLLYLTTERLAFDTSHIILDTFGYNNSIQDRVYDQEN